MARKTLQVKDLAAGASYVVQVRAIGDDEETANSPWSLSLNLTTDEDTTGPGQVQNVALVASAADFKVSWSEVTLDGDGQPLTDLKDYKVVWCETSSLSGGIYQNQFVQYTSSLSAQLSYEQNVAELGGVEDVVVQVYARDYANNESASAGTSNAVTNVEPATFTGLTADRDQDGQAIAVEWPQPAGAAADGSNNADDLDYYDVYRDGNKIQTIAFSPGNVRYLDPDPRPGVHSYYVIAYDKYGNSKQSNSDTAEPIYVGQDTIPPAAVESLVLTPGAEPDSLNAYLTYIDVVFDAPIVNDDSPTNSDYTDNNGFAVRYRVNGSGDPYEYIMVPDERSNPPTDPRSTTIRVDRLEAGTTYEIGVAAFDTSENYSTYVSSTAATAADTTPPGQPSAPTASSDTQSVLVSHDLTLQATGLLPEDVVELKVYASESPTFAVGDPGVSQLGVLPTSRPSVGIDPVGKFILPNTETATDSGTARDWYIAVVAVDAAGNESDLSPKDMAAPGLIDSAFMANATIGDAKINDLSVSKLTAGAGFIENLTIGTSGSIASDNFDGDPDNGTGSSVGWWLGETGLIINDGTIEAAALNIALPNANLVPHEYSYFPNKSTYYQDTNVIVPGTGTVDISAQYKYGNQSLIWDPASFSSLRFAATGEYNIPVEAGQQYVFSAYVRNDSGSASNATPRLSYDDTTFENGSTESIASGAGWIRIQSAFTIPVGVTAVALEIQTAFGAPLQIDALQFEESTSGLASFWKVPGYTAIDGGSITTGAIESTNFDTGVSGWQINLDGTAEFQNGLFRGEITAESGSITGDLEVSGTLSNASAPNSRYELSSTGFRFFNSLNEEQFTLDTSTGEFSLNIKESGSSSGDSSFTNYELASEFTGIDPLGVSSFSVDELNYEVDYTTDGTSAGWSILKINALDSTTENILVSSRLVKQPWSAGNYFLETGIGLYITINSSGVITHGLTAQVTRISQATSYSRVTVRSHSPSNNNVNLGSVLVDADVFDVGLSVVGDRVELYIDGSAVASYQRPTNSGSGDYNGIIVRGDLEARNNILISQNTVIESPLYIQRSLILPASQFNIYSDGRTLIGGDGTARPAPLDIKPNGVIIQSSPFGNSTEFSPGLIEMGSLVLSERDDGSVAMRELEFRQLSGSILTSPYFITYYDESGAPGLDFVGLNRSQPSISVRSGAEEPGISLAAYNDTVMSLKFVDGGNTEYPFELKRKNQSLEIRVKADSLFYSVGQSFFIVSNDFGTEHLIVQYNDSTWSRYGYEVPNGQSLANANNNARITLPANEVQVFAGASQIASFLSNSVTINGTLNVNTISMATTSLIDSATHRIEFRRVGTVDTLWLGSNDTVIIGDNLGNTEWVSFTPKGIIVPPGTTADPSVEFFNGTGFHTPFSTVIESSEGGSRGYYMAPAIFTGIGDNTRTLGNASNRWVNVWAVDTTINNSDPRLKTDTAPLDKQDSLNFINQLQPIKGRWKKGKRTHTWLNAEQVKQVLDQRGEDLALYIDPAKTSDEELERDIPTVVNPDLRKSDPEEYKKQAEKARESIRNSPKGLRYNEFIAPLIAAVQALTERIEQLEKDRK